MTLREEVDVAIVGGGIVGLATARSIMAQRPDLSLTVIEKEAAVGQHQTGNNSGVIHAGVYYKPGSLKAELTLTGRAQLVEFCAERGIRYDICGKLIVATRQDELASLDTLAQRAVANNVAAVRLDAAGLREHEPHVAGIAGMYVPSTGIIDYPAVCNALADDVLANGHELRLNAEMTGMDEENDAVVIETGHHYLRAKVLVNCAGLYSDKVANLGPSAGTNVRIMPFRGEYYKLKPHRRHLVNNLIYPVPDPAFPFLGVHYTRMIGGGVEAGPNAVPALAREGYSWGRVNLAELAEIGRASSTWVLGRKYWKTQLGEFYRSASKKAFVTALQRLIPEITADDLVKGGAGVRAQAIAPDGTLLDDFAFAETARQVHVINAPSPAATASLAIGAKVATKALERLA